ncbi:hypothetical protein D3C84_863100 [compost metagenome]
MPGELRLPGLQRVVQHQALTVDVVVQELVMGQAGTIRRNDVDDGHAALGLQLRGAAGAWRDHYAPCQSVGQVSNQEQAGNCPAQFAPRGKMKRKCLCRHKNLSIKVRHHVAR